MERGGSLMYNDRIIHFKEVVTMKKSRTVLIAAGALVLILAAVIGSMGIFYQSTTNNAESLYSQIDNERLEPITPHGGMNYRYTIPAYTESGAEKNLELDTSHELRDGAYILVKTAPLRGVISWEEVTFEQLPPPVQAHYAE